MLARKKILYLKTFEIGSFSACLKLAIILFSISMTLTGCVSAKYAAPDVDRAAREYLPDPINAVVYIVRESAFVAGGVKLPVTVDAQKIGDIKQGTFYRLLLSPGEHDLFVSNPVAKRDAFLSLNVDAGEVYFVTVRMELGGDALPILAMVSEQEISKVIADCSLVIPDNEMAAKYLYASEDVAYSKIENTDDIDKLKEFLASYPDSLRKSAIRDRISATELARKQYKLAQEEDEYQKAKEENSYAAYVGFLSKFPDGAYSGDIKARIQSFDWIELDDSELVSWEELGIKPRSAEDIGKIKFILGGYATNGSILVSGSDLLFASPGATFNGATIPPSNLRVEPGIVLRLTPEDGSAFLTLDTVVVLGHMSRIKIAESGTPAHISRLSVRSGILTVERDGLKIEAGAVFIKDSSR